MGEMLKRTKGGKFLGFYLRWYEGGKRRASCYEFVAGWRDWVAFGCAERALRLGTSQALPRPRARPPDAGEGSVGRAAHAAGWCCGSTA